MASSNVIIRKCEGQGINVQGLNGLTYSGTRQDFKFQEDIYIHM